MKKLFLFTLLVTSLSGIAQQQNTLLDAEFWKKSPDVATVQAEVAKGNSATEFNASSFDATTMAINNGAPAETIKFLLGLEGNGVNKITHDSRIYLHWAAYKGNAELVNYLLEKGSDVNAQDSHGYTPLAFGAANGLSNATVYDAFFKTGVDPKKKYDGTSLLLLAVANDSKELTLTNYFVSKGLSVKDTDANGSTAIDYAARTGNTDVIKALQKKGVKHTGNALIFASEGTRRGANSIEVFKFLVDDLKIKPTVTDKDGKTVLHALARKPKQEEIITYFLGKGVDVNVADKNGNTAFMIAASGKDAAVLNLLLPKVKDINAVNSNGESALTMAVEKGSADVVTLLLSGGAKTDVKDKKGNNLAYYLIESYRPQPFGAARGGENKSKDDFSEKMKALQSNGFILTAPQADGSTLYHLAAAKNDLKLIKSLASLKVDVNTMNNEGLTALHKAALLAKSDEILKYLVSIGAKKEIRTEFDETAYALAKENEYLSKNNVSVDFLK